jgi:hypothetical protein
MKTLALKLTDSQFARINKIAALLSAEPDQVLVALTLSDLDACVGEWGEWEQCFQHALEFYVDGGRASEEEPGHRFEDSAPTRRLLLAKK